MTDVHQVERLKTNLEYWLNLNEDSFSYYLSRQKEIILAKDAAESVSFDFFRDDLENAKKTCKLFLNSFDDIVELTPDFENFTNKVSRATLQFSYYLATTALIFPDGLKTSLSNFQKLLDDYLNSLIKMKDFDYSLKAETDELTNYARIGELINSDSDYNGSPICKLEKIVLAQIRSFNALKRSLRGEPSLNEPVMDEDGEPTRISDLMKHYLGANSIRRNDDVLETMFHAIVAPSMEGKTQSAFVFRKIRPLYFLLAEESYTGSSAIQSIYKNFTDLSDKFREIASDDYSCISALIGRNISSSDYDHVSARALLTNHGDFQFLSLGFLVALMEHANVNFSADTMNWMKFFATSPRNFTFRALTINQVRKRNIDGNYALFFDEFEAEGWTVMVRNLARAALIPLFVANTNTNAFNLVGKVTAASSRINKDYGWSLVSVNLNPVNMRIYRNIDERYLNKIDLITRAAGNEQELVRSFFADFKNNQLPHLRPGFVKLISENIVNISEATPLTLNDILKKIVDPMISELLDKKPKMSSKPEAVLGTFALFMNNAYLSDDEVELSHIYHRKIYLQDHFYYLVNPVDNTKWAFLTYPPADSQSLRYVQNIYFNTSSCANWDIEYTYFKSEEIIPMFAFFAASNKKSIEACSREGLKVHNSSPFGTGDTRNMAQKVPLNGNVLEVLSAVCVIDSSRYNTGDFDSTFSGQDGKSFLINLVENLIYAEGFRRTKKVVIDLPEIDTFLNRMHVPYLFPSGMKLPVFFKKNLSDAAGFNNRSVHFGEYHRSPDRKEIDSIFNYFIKNEQNNPPIEASCAVECKYWEKHLYVSELKQIIKKAVNNSAKLSLVICNSVGGAKESTIAGFKENCTTKNWNVMKLYKIRSDGFIRKRFKLVPYFPELSLVTDPALTCIVLELDTINA